MSDESSYLSSSLEVWRLDLSPGIIAKNPTVVDSFLSPLTDRTAHFRSKVRRRECVGEGMMKETDEKKGKRVRAV